jgi:hypothetical protein
MTPAVVVTALETLFGSHPHREPRSAPATMIKENIKESSN